MCNATAAAVGLQAGGTALQLQGQRLQIEANKETAKYNVQILEKRADRIDGVMREHAKDAENQAVTVIRRGREVLGAGRGALAGNRVIVGSGSALDWERGLEGDIAGDVQQVATNLRRQLTALGQERENIQDAIVYEQWRSETGAQAGYIGMGATALQGGANIAATLI